MIQLKFIVFFVIVGFFSACSSQTEDSTTKAVLIDGSAVEYASAPRFEESLQSILAKKIKDFPISCFVSQPSAVLPSFGLDGKFCHSADVGLDFVKIGGLFMARVASQGLAIPIASIDDNLLLKNFCTKEFDLHCNLEVETETDTRIPIRFSLAEDWQESDEALPIESLRGTKELPIVLSAESRDHSGFIRSFHQQEVYFKLAHPQPSMRYSLSLTPDISDLDIAQLPESEENSSTLSGTDTDTIEVVSESGEPVLFKVFAAHGQPNAGPQTQFQLRVTEGSLKQYLQLPDPEEFQASGERYSLKDAKLEGDEAFISIEVPEDKKIVSLNIQLTPLENDIDIELIDAEGQTIDSSAMGSTEVDTVSFLSLAPGQYTIRLAAADYLSDSNENTFDLEVLLVEAK